MAKKPTRWEPSWWSQPRSIQTGENRKLPPFIDGFTRLRLARLQVEYTGFLYELLSRHAGRYLLKTSFNQLDRKVIWQLRDRLAPILTPKMNPVTAFGPHEEVKIAGSASGFVDGFGWGEPAIDKAWSAPYCVNLARSNKEIIEAVEAKLVLWRKEKNIPNPRRYQSKGPPWRLVLALQDSSPAAHLYDAKKWVDQWHRAHGTVVETVCDSLCTKI